MFGARLVGRTPGLRPRKCRSEPDAPNHRISGAKLSEAARPGLAQMINPQVSYSDLAGIRPAAGANEWLLQEAREPRLYSPLSSRQASTFSPSAIRPILSIETFRS